MATHRRDKSRSISSKVISSTNSEIDPEVTTMLDAMQKQNEILNQRIERLIRCMDGILTSRSMRNISESSSLINEVTHTSRDQSDPREPLSRSQIPSQSSEDRELLQRFMESKIKATVALKCIPQLNGESDITVEEFIQEVKEVRMMCSEQSLLLKRIKIQKIVGKAATAIRNIRINDFESLYEALRRNVGSQTSAREQRDKLREIKQGSTESVRNYNIRFRRAFSKFKYSITNECKDESSRQVMNDRLNIDFVNDYIRGLRPEIGQLLLANLPSNIADAEQRAMDVQKYFREDNARKRSTQRTIAPPPDRTSRPVDQTSRPVDNSFTITNNIYDKTSPVQLKTTIRQSEPSSLAKRTLTTMVQMQSSWKRVKTVFKLMNRPTGRRFSHKHHSSYRRL